jgi:hypothetical protein
MQSGLIQAVELRLQLHGGVGEGLGEFGASFFEPVGLFTASAGELVLDGATHAGETFVQAICNLLAKVSFRLLQAHGHVGSGSSELLGEGIFESCGLFGKRPSYISLRTRCEAAYEQKNQDQKDSIQAQHEFER